MKPEEVLAVIATVASALSAGIIGYRSYLDACKKENAEIENLKRERLLALQNQAMKEIRENASPIDAIRKYSDETLSYLASGGLHHSADLDYRPTKEDLVKVK